MLHLSGETYGGRTECAAQPSSGATWQIGVVWGWQKWSVASGRVSVTDRAEVVHATSKMCLGRLCMWLADMWCEKRPECGSMRRLRAARVRLGRTSRADVLWNRHWQRVRQGAAEVAPFDDVAFQFAKRRNPIERTLVSAVRNSEPERIKGWA
ncbi:hypothetical protein BKA93DRAFT_250279 [Sparassis latifolia]